MSSYIVGVILIGLLMLAIQDLPAIMNSALPVKDILATSVGSAFANVISPAGGACRADVDRAAGNVLDRAHCGVSRRRVAAGPSALSGPAGH